MVARTEAQWDARMPAASTKRYVTYAPPGVPRPPLRPTWPTPARWTGGSSGPGPRSGPSDSSSTMPRSRFQGGPPWCSVSLHLTRARWSDWGYVVGASSQPLSFLSALGIPPAPRTGLFAAYRLMQCALPDMIEAGRGGIVNISSLAGFIPGEGPYPHPGAPGPIAYGGNKAALHHLTQSVAIEMQAYGIAVNALSPGQNRSSRPGTWSQRPAKPTGPVPRSSPRPRSGSWSQTLR